MSMINQMSGAADIVLNRERGLQKLDTSADGFFASFKGLGFVALIDGASMILSHSTRLKLGDTPMTNAVGFTAAMLFVALTAYGASMLALFLLCRTEETQRRFSTAVIVHNWAAPVISLAFQVPFIVLLLLRNNAYPETPSAMASIILFVMIGLLVIIGVRLLRISLNIANGQAFSLFAITAGVSMMIELWLTRLFGL